MALPPTSEEVNRVMEYILSKNWLGSFTLEPSEPASEYPRKSERMKLRLAVARIAAACDPAADLKSLPNKVDLAILTEKGLNKAPPFSPALAKIGRPKTRAEGKAQLLLLMQQIQTLLDAPFSVPSSSATSSALSAPRTLPTVEEVKRAFLRMHIDDIDGKTPNGVQSPNHRASRAQSPDKPADRSSSSSPEQPPRRSTRLSTASVMSAAPPPPARPSPRREGPTSPSPHPPSPAVGSKRPRALEIPVSGSPVRASPSQPRTSSQFDTTMELIDERLQRLGNLTNIAVRPEDSVAKFYRERRAAALAAPPTPSASVAGDGGSRKRRRFTEEEDECLKAGVAKFGFGSNLLWSNILKEYPGKFPGRKGVDLKDRWRNLSKGAPSVAGTL